jgi:hypothetical protein
MSAAAGSFVLSTNGTFCSHDHATERISLGLPLQELRSNKIKYIWLATNPKTSINLPGLQDRFTCFQPLVYANIIQGLDIKSQEYVQQKVDERPLHLLASEAGGKGT